MGHEDTESDQDRRALKRATDALDRVFDGDLTSIAHLRSVPWQDIVRAMSLVDRQITRPVVRRVLLQSLDPATSKNAQSWAGLVFDGSLDEWTVEDGFLVSYPNPPGREEIEFTFEPGWEDPILEVLRRIDDINIDGTIAADELDRLLSSLS